MATPMPMKQHLHSRLAEIDTDMQTLKSEMTRSVDGRSQASGPRRLGPDHRKSPGPSRGDASPSEPSRMSPLASRVVTAANTRAASPERGGDRSRVVTTPWSNFVPFAQNKLTWVGNTTFVGSPSPIVAGPPLAQLSPSSSQVALTCGSPAVPQGIASVGGCCSPKVPLGEIVATAGPPGGGSPARVSSVRPLQDQRVSQVR
eukprot:3941183-Amphidinium_carterae.1